jgi:hypothetical protein
VVNSINFFFKFWFFFHKNFKIIIKIILKASLKPIAVIGVVDSFDFELYFPRVRLDDNNLELILELVRTLESIGLSSKKNFYIRMNEYVQLGTLKGPNYLTSHAKKEESQLGVEASSIQGGINVEIGSEKNETGVIGKGQMKKEGARMSLAEMMMRKLDQQTGLSIQHGFLAMQIGFWAKLMEKIDDLSNLCKQINKEIGEERGKKEEEKLKKKDKGKGWLLNSQKIFELLKFRDIVQTLISKNVR